MKKVNIRIIIQVYFNCEDINEATIGSYVRKDISVT